MKTPKMPTPAAPVRVPTPDDPDVMMARKRRTMEEENSRKGRSSTSLSGGAADYSRTTLG
jgi:hypothetical protein